MNILSIGGSDPSSGAGIQGDVRTLAGLGAHCLTVITAITSQNTSGYSGTSALPARLVGAQLDSVISDFELGAIKVGMLYGADIARRVASGIRRAGAPVIVDPVIVSTTGGRLLRRSALHAFCSEILPLADVITPNLAEAEAVTGRRGPEACAEWLISRGAGSVIITGMRRGRHVCDYVFAPSMSVVRAGAAAPGQGRGGGCAHSAAVAFEMARHGSVLRAARFAARLASGQILHGVRAGAGAPIAGAPDYHAAALHDAISALCALRGAHRLVPECQSNFVLAPPGAASAGDMLGVRGRIVRAGAGLVVAGGIARGGSEHVASALAAMRTRFPGVSSCMNMRRTPQALAAMRRLGMQVASFDRAREPRLRSRREGTTMAWGIGAATARLAAAPDAVQNAGGYQKEPMILVFGRDAADVVSKMRRILGALD